MHDPRLGRFFTVDPLTVKYSWNSTYAFSENRVLDGIDLEGREWFYAADGILLGRHGDDPTIRVFRDSYSEETTRTFMKMVHKTVYLNTFMLMTDDFEHSRNALNVVKSIYNNELGLEEERKQGVEFGYYDGHLANCECDGFGNNFDGEGNPRIGVNLNKTGSNKNDVSLALLKESNHVIDSEAGYQTLWRDVNGYLPTLNSEYFQNSTSDMKKTFLSGAGAMIWTYINASKVALDKSDSKLYMQSANHLIGEFKKKGVEFDFSKLENTLEKAGRQNIPADNNSVGVTLNGEEL